MIQSSQRLVRPRLEREVRLAVERNAYRYVSNHPVREPLAMVVLVTGIVAWCLGGLFVVAWLVRLVTE